MIFKFFFFSQELLCSLINIGNLQNQNNLTQCQHQLETMQSGHKDNDQIYVPGTSLQQPTTNYEANINAPFNTNSSFSAIIDNQRTLENVEINKPENYTMLPFQYNSNILPMFSPSINPEIEMIKKEMVSLGAIFDLLKNEFIIINYIKQKLLTTQDMQKMAQDLIKAYSLSTGILNPNYHQLQQQFTFLVSKILDDIRKERAKEQLPQNYNVATYLPLETSSSFINKQSIIEYYTGNPLFYAPLKPLDVPLANPFFGSYQKSPLPHGQNIQSPTLNKNLNSKIISNKKDSKFNKFQDSQRNKSQDSFKMQSSNVKHHEKTCYQSQHRGPLFQNDYKSKNSYFDLPKSNFIYKKKFRNSNCNISNRKISSFTANQLNVKGDKVNAENTVLFSKHAKRNEYQSNQECAIKQINSFITNNNKLSGDISQTTSNKKTDDNLSYSNEKIGPNYPCSSFVPITTEATVFGIRSSDTLPSSNTAFTNTIKEDNLHDYSKGDENKIII